MPRGDGVGLVFQASRSTTSGLATSRSMSVLPRHQRWPGSGRAWHRTRRSSLRGRCRPRRWRDLPAWPGSVEAVDSVGQPVGREGARQPLVQRRGHRLFRQVHIPEMLAVVGQRVLVRVPAPTAPTSWQSHQRLSNADDAERSRLESAIARQVVPHLAELPNQLRQLSHLDHKHQATVTPDTCRSGH